MSSSSSSSNPSASPVSKLRRGWFEHVKPNQSLLLNHLEEMLGERAKHLPKRMFADKGDISKENWVRSPSDPNVIKLRKYLKENNGIPGLEICQPHEVKKAAAIFRRDGFVAVANVLTPEQLKEIKGATERVLDDILSKDPDASIGGGAGSLPLRYSFGVSSATRQMLHDMAWCNLIDLPTTTPILQEIFGVKNKFTLIGAGGDVCLPGAIEYQRLHRDLQTGKDPYVDKTGRTTLLDLPPPMVTINFCMVDFTFENGPTRQIKGTQNMHVDPPALIDEPEWMKLSTCMPIKAGGCLFRDPRAWHGGTPNLSNHVRAIPNVEYGAPWFRHPDAGYNFTRKTLPYDNWIKLSDHAQKITKGIRAEPGQPVIGAGFMHPDFRKREAYVYEQTEKRKKELGIAKL